MGTYYSKQEWQRLLQMQAGAPTYKQKPIELYAASRQGKVRFAPMALLAIIRPLPCSSFIGRDPLRWARGRRNEESDLGYRFHSVFGILLQVKILTHHLHDE